MEQLEKAFQQVPGLTALDVINPGKDAYGVLVKGFELERASAMQPVLAAQRIETEVVEDAALPELPPPRQLIKADFIRLGPSSGRFTGRKVRWRR